MHTQTVITWAAFSMPPINLYNAPRLEGLEMQNWIQEIDPQIKDKHGDLNTRQQKVIATLLEADLYWQPGKRNMAGDLFTRFANMKYAAPFMEALKPVILKRFDQVKADRLLNTHRVIPSWEMKRFPDSDQDSPKRSMRP